MSVPLPKDVIEILNDSGAVKVLATVDERGIPHVVVKDSLQPGEKGTLVYLELLESSRTNRNLVRTLWFDGKVSVSLSDRAGKSFQIKGRPVKTHITGPLFRRYYEAVRERLGDVDLAGVWVIEADEVIEETFAVRKIEEEKAHPFFLHLDRLTSENSETK